MKIILASSSPRRKELLEQMGLKFEICKPDVEEVSEKIKPHEYVMELSQIKGECIANKQTHYQNLVIASDTIVWFENKILEKPNSYDEAIKTLHSMSGKEHEVYTSVSCFLAGEQLHFFDKTIVKFHELTDEFIKKYVNSGEPMDKAGSYGIQGLGQVMVESIKGNYSTVMGFPTSMFYQKLSQWEPIQEYNITL